MPKAKKLLPPIHPGEILRSEFMEPLRLSMNRLALDLRVPVTRVAEIVHERRAITPDTALRLARYFNTSAGFWLNLQSPMISKSRRTSSPAQLSVKFDRPHSRLRMPPLDPSFHLSQISPIPAC